MMVDKTTNVVTKLGKIMTVDLEPSIGQQNVKIVSRSLNHSIEIS